MTLTRIAKTADEAMLANTTKKADSMTILLDNRLVLRQEKVHVERSPRVVLADGCEQRQLASLEYWLYYTYDFLLCSHDVRATYIKH